MKIAYYIMQLNQVGNIGPHQIRKISDQPLGGYASEEAAEIELFKLMEKGKYPFDMWYSFSIIKLYSK